MIMTQQHRFSSSILNRFFKSTLKKWQLLTLLVITLLSRLAFVLPGAVPFSFDHGKDSIAVMHMWETISPKLIGPWTSIPGLFFGPGWYYFLTPFYLLTGGHPVGFILLPIFLVLVQVYLMHRYFGFSAALMITCLQTWTMISTSAWNPFPMPLVTVLILIFLRKIREQGSNVSDKLDAVSSHKYISQFFRSTYINWIALGFILAMGFHFSTAFAIFYLPILIIFWLFSWYPRPNPKQFCFFAVGVLLPFIPQVVFEFSHQFLEIKGVLAYLQNPESHAVSIEKMNYIKSIINGDFELTTLPGFASIPSNINKIIQTFFTLSFAAIFLKNFRSLKLSQDLKEALVFITVPFIGFTFLHFNVWYPLGLIPIYAIVINSLLKLSPRVFRYLYHALLICTLFSKLFIYFTSELPEHKKFSDFLTVKQTAFQLILDRTNQGSIPFSVYTYKPDIYDYPYQYLWFWQAKKNGQLLPVEFSYKPGEISYIPEKVELLTRFKQQQGPAQKIFFIVEKPGVQSLLDEWWNHQNYSKIVETVEITPNLTLFEATPK